MHNAVMYIKVLNPTHVDVGHAAMRAFALCAIVTMNHYDPHTLLTYIYMKQLHKGGRFGLL